MGDYWHQRTRERFVDAVPIAAEAGQVFASEDLPLLWAVGLSLSYWHDEDDNRGLWKLRDALLQIPKGTAERHPLVEALDRTDRSSSLDQLPKVDGEAESPGENNSLPPAPMAGSSALDEARRGRPVLPSVAASVIKAIRTCRPRDEAEQVAVILGSVGTEYTTAWAYGERSILASLKEIVRHVTDDELWRVAEAAARRFDGHEPNRLYWTYPNLLALCLARAVVYEDDELLSTGLSIQLDMHARWARVRDCDGGAGWPATPAVESGMTWRTAAVRLLGILLTSYSSEVITAALEGAHALVAATPAVIPELFSECSSQWQRHWLLSAAESWASLHPESMHAVRPQLMCLLSSGGLSERLQSWIILSKVSSRLGTDPPAFSAPVGAARVSPTDAGPRSGLLLIPRDRLGHALLTDSHSGPLHTLQTLWACGWSFPSVEAEIASLIAELPPDDMKRKTRAPHRRADFYCTDLGVDSAVGQVILSRLGDEVITQGRTVRLAQGFLGNDDAWLQRSPPRRATGQGPWPPTSDYGPPEDLPEAEVRQTLSSLAESLDVAEGWKTFAARVQFCTGKFDYVLDLWYEERSASLLLSLGDYPSCPSGRTFLWYLGDFFEPAIGGIGFVSGYFVGGRQRLNHDILHIQPSQAWRDRFGWSVGPTDPLTWHADGESVARYERIHGPLRRTINEPHFRQPLIDRWIIRQTSFFQIEARLGPLRHRDDLRRYLYRS